MCNQTNKTSKFWEEFQNFPYCCHISDRINPNTNLVDMAFQNWTMCRLEVTPGRLPMTLKHSNFLYSPFCNQTNKDTHNINLSYTTEKTMIKSRCTFEGPIDLQLLLFGDPQTTPKLSHPWPTMEAPGCATLGCWDSSQRYTLSNTLVTYSLGCHSLPQLK